MDSVSSTTFIGRQPQCRSSRGEETLIFARDILLNRLFVGVYVERRHVGKLEDYRDVVTISAAETELIYDLEKMRQSICRNCSAKWVGITGPESENAPAGYCLWVKLKNIPFGQFWFQIKEISYENEEIIFKLKCIRPVRPEDYGDGNKEVKKGNLEEYKKSREKGPSEYAFEFDPAEKLNLLYGYLNEGVRQVRPHLTWGNFLLAGKFVMAMVIVLVSAMITSIHYMGEYFLRLIRELAFLLQSITPFLVHAVSSITKVVGGLFLLIAVLFRIRIPQQFQTQFPSQRKYPALPQPPEASSAFMSRSTPPNPTSFVPVYWRERNRAIKEQFLSEANYVK